MGTSEIFKDSLDMWGVQLLVPGQTLTRLMEFSACLILFVQAQTLRELASNNVFLCLPALWLMKSELACLLSLLICLHGNGLKGLKAKEAFSPLDCKRAVKRLGLSPESLEVPDLWETCCDPLRFDVYGHRSVCFKGASTWEVQNCCAALQQPYHFRIILQKVVTSTGRQKNKLEKQLAKVRNSLNEFAVVTYHKTGTFVATQLLGYNLQQGPLAALLLKNSSKRWEASLWQNASIIDHEIEGTTTWMRQSLAGRISLLYNPPEHDMAAQRRLYFTLAAGKLIHFIRRPSEIIISSYLYHLQGSKFEYWMHTRNPPNCHHCDFAAWDLIFRPCAFHCTFFDRLQQIDVKEGLRVEILRARWTIAKMLNNWNRWRTASNVLHVQAKDFQTNLTRTLHKIAKFLKPNLKPTSSLGRFVSMARAWGLDLQYAGDQCKPDASHKSELCSAHLQFALSHASSLRNAPDKLKAQETLTTIAEWRKYIKPADDFFNKLTRR